MDENSTNMSQDFAEQEFDRICRAARVKFELMRTLDGKDADKQKAIIVDAIIDGEITVDGDGFPTVHTPHDDEKLKAIKIFRRPIRSEKLMIDRTKHGNNVEAQNAVMGKFLNLSKAEVAALEEVDFQRVEALWLLFLGY